MEVNRSLFNNNFEINDLFQRDTILSWHLDLRGLHIVALRCASESFLSRE